MITVERFASDHTFFKEEIAFKIRAKVFVEEQNVSREEEFDEFETIATHYLLFVDKEPVGTARWRETAQGVKLERFALLEKFRNKGLGNILLKAVLKDVIPLNKTIYLHAQLPAINFYEREGFVKQGELFWECDIAHYLMHYNRNFSNAEKFPN